MKEYKLFGFLNMFALVPDFIYPIFAQENILYIQEGEDDQLSAIVPLKEELYNKVVPLGRYNDAKYPVEHLNITTESSPKYAFQISKNNVIYGDSKILLEYLDAFSTNDEILEQEISDFKTDVGYNIMPRIVKEVKLFHFHATGRRKSSVARVYLKHGTGKIKINKRDINEYFGMETLRVIVKQPLIATDTVNKFDVIVNVHGGGYTGQAGAIRHGISRALLQVDTAFRPTLKKEGFLTRDPRMKERKKYGLKGARRAPQFSKR